MAELEQLALVLRLCRVRHNKSIHGELSGLGVKVAASTVWEILRTNGIDPAARRTGPTWAQFLRSQAEAILACDFFSVDLLDGTQAYVLTVMGTRRGASASSASRCIRPGTGPPSRPAT